MIVIILVAGIAGAIVLFAVGIVIGVFSKKAQAQYMRAIDVVGTIFLKGIVVVMGAGILYVVALAVLSTR